MRKLLPKMGFDPLMVDNGALAPPSTPRLAVRIRVLWRHVLFRLLTLCTRLRAEYELIILDLQCVAYALPCSSRMATDAAL